MNTIPGVTVINGKVGQLTALANLSYDFMPAARFTPYIGAGAGVAFVDSNTSLGSTQFAYDGFIGIRYNISNALTVGLEGRYLGTTNPSITVAGQTFSSQNQTILGILGFAYKFGQTETVAAAPPQPAAPQAPSFMVFFDWDRSNLSAQALNTIKQAAGVYQTKGSARITATGHTDKSGPESYNMALSLRRANTAQGCRWCVKACWRRRFSVIGKGESSACAGAADRRR